MLSLGIDDPVTRDSYSSESKYMSNLAKELTDILLQPLKVLSIISFVSLQLFVRWWWIKCSAIYVLFSFIIEFCCSRPYAGISPQNVFLKNLLHALHSYIKLVSRTTVAPNFFNDRVLSKYVSTRFCCYALVLISALIAL